MKDEVLALIDRGVSYQRVGKKFGLTKGMVAGIVHRARHPNEERDRHKAKMLESGKVGRQFDRWTDARLTETWENRKLRRIREGQRHA